MSRKSPPYKLSAISYKLNSGQMLVESLVAISVLTMGFLGMVTLLSRALSLNRVIADNYTATYLAVEGVEVVKNMIDGNIRRGGNTPWNLGFQDGSFELDYNSNSLSSFNRGEIRLHSNTGLYGNSGSLTPFRRRIDIDLIGSDEMTVNSEVTWVTRGGGSFSVNIEDHFYNWKP